MSISIDSVYLYPTISLIKNWRLKNDPHQILFFLIEVGYYFKRFGLFRNVFLYVYEYYWDTHLFF
jgi:hypothetical protein